jgi:hypothetical protein
MALAGMTSSIGTMPNFSKNGLVPDWMHAEHSTGVNIKFIYFIFLKKKNML